MATLNTTVEVHVSGVDVEYRIHKACKEAMDDTTVGYTRAEAILFAADRWGITTQTLEKEFDHCLQLRSMSMK